MNVQCSHCQTVFRVDPAKVPAGGLRARCSICRGVFEVAGADGAVPSPQAGGASQAQASTPAPAQSGTAAPASTPAPVSAPAATPTPAPASSPAPASAPTATPASAPAASPVQPAPRPTPAPAAAPAATVAPTPAPAPKPASTPAPATTSTRPPPSFGSTDPNAKARRLARALVSDIVTYHPERRDKTLADGTLKREFMDEIKKSWEEYVEQVGADMARSTPHFRDALNDILAKGQQLF
jgi:predicted Zn finger-like uncharacterized protein